jgi:glycosyltransferase involved in cell wall biosynthesis
VKPVILIPSFNHAETLPGVVTAVQRTLAAARQAVPILVVNDGSTDATAQALQTIKDVQVATHAKNRGKGAALRTGFLFARDQGFSHVISMDADGQHDPADVLKVLAAARAHPEDLIIGQRDMDACPTVPLASKKGRNAARFWLHIQTGCDIPDTQCGLRAYPLASALAVPQRFTRYDFETEILARLSWGGVAIRSVPVACIYFPRDRRVTHFRPLIDTLRGVWVNVFLIARRLAPLPFRRLVAKHPATESAQFGAWWRWASWRDAVRNVLRAGSSNAELAMALAMGIFIGLTPFYLLHALIAIYFARRLHLNVLAAILGSQISIPPLVPLWVGLSYAIGELLLHGRWDFHPLMMNWRKMGSEFFWPALVGNLPMAVGVAMLGLLVARLLLYCFRGPANAPVAARVEPLAETPA